MTALTRRLTSFHTSTKPILSYYKEHQVLAEIQANDKISNIWQNIQDRLG